MKNLSVLILIGFLTLSAGCAENRTRIGEGAGLGGLLGAAAGGIIGHQSGHGMEGALIGGAVGVGSGAFVGSQMEKKPTAAQEDSGLAGGQLTIRQVVDWSKNGMTSDDIINRIEASNSRYNLTEDDVDYLNRQGVSQRVIEAMQMAR